MRMMYATPTITSVATGSTSASGASSGLPSGGNSETAGNTCRRTAKSRTSRVPVTNSGTAISPSDVQVMPVSVPHPVDALRRRRARRPAGS